MKAKIITLLIMAISLSVHASKPKTVKLQIIETSDIHGAFFPWDFINKKTTNGSLAHLSSYLTKVRKENPDGVILLDNGDILQGQPINYYYNYVATDKTNIAAELLNYFGYDAQNLGNHDVEPGHKVYDKWISELNCPVLGANIIDTNTGKPYCKPYAVIERQGVKVAVIGLITAAIPNWLPDNIWSGLEFKEMVSSAREWIDIVKKNENPDVIIGLFHSGKEGGIVTDKYTENISLYIAQNVPGFDVVMFGHDHSTFCEMVDCVDGSKVLAIDPTNAARYAAEAVITVTKKGNKLISKNVEGHLVKLNNETADNEFVAHFQKSIDEVNDWCDRKIGNLEETITTQDCFFGSSAFTDLVHNLQLELTGADISISAPLTFNTTMQKGEITVSDMFKLYKFENTLYTMRLSGKEIRKALEMSYCLWTNTMTSPDDHIMLLKPTTNDNKEHNSFLNPTFNFDSAAGIDYVVDVTKPEGEKVKILQMTNGEPFDENKMYKVAVNSYRGNGGGQLLTKGAGIPEKELDNRIITRTERDQRHYLMLEIEKRKTIAPKANNNWRFVPEEWTEEAIKRDRNIIFGK